MRFKRSIKRVAVAAGRHLSRPDQSARRVVLCYHSIHPGKPYASTTPEAFELHLEWLKENTRLTSLRDLVEGKEDAVHGKPAVAITFDDGYEDGHSYALPILAKYGAPATFFITAGFVEREPAVLDRFQRLWRCGPGDLDPLDWGQVLELHSSGMDIGSHSYSHANLADLAPVDVARELRESRDIIGGRLGEAVDLFAYPFGKPRVHFTAGTARMVRDAGYGMAAAVSFRGIRSVDSPYRIPRFFADGDEIFKLEQKTRGAYDLIGWWQEHAPVWLMNVVSPDDFRK